MNVKKTDSLYVNKFIVVNLSDNPVYGQFATFTETLTTFHQPGPPEETAFRR